MTDHELVRFIDAQRLTVLATVNRSLKPEAALVGFAVTPALELVFDTLRTTRKYANLLADPHIAFVISEGEITLQYEGVAALPADEDLARAKETYFTKWPECRAHESWPDIAYFLVRPQWVRYSDYNQSPPFIVEREFATS